MKNIYIPLPMDLYLEYTNKLVDSTVEDVAEQIVVNMEEFASNNPESLPLFSYVINFYYGKIPLSIFPIVKKKITNMFFARVWKVEFNQKNEGYYIKVHPLMDNKEYIDFCEKNENDINELLIKYKVKKMSNTKIKIKSPQDYYDEALDKYDEIKNEIITKINNLIEYNMVNRKFDVDRYSYFDFEILGHGLKFPIENDNLMRDIIYAFSENGWKLNLQHYRIDNDHIVYDTFSITASY